MKSIDKRDIRKLKIMIKNGGKCPDHIGDCNECPIDLIVHSSDHACGCTYDLANKTAKELLKQYKIKEILK